MKNDVKPKGIQLQRSAGFSLQTTSRNINGLPAIKVDRTTAHGNPFVVCGGRTAAEAVELFRETLAGWPAEKLEAYLAPLRGHNLACWCAHGTPCHRDILLQLMAAPILRSAIVATFMAAMTGAAATKNA